MRVSSLFVLINTRDKLVDMIMTMDAQRSYLTNNKDEKAICTFITERTKELEATAEKIDALLESVQIPDIQET